MLQRHKCAGAQKGGEGREQVPETPKCHASIRLHFLAPDGKPYTAFVRTNAYVTILQSQNHVLSSFSDPTRTLSYDSVGRHRAGLVKGCSNAALGALCHPVLIVQYWCRCVLAPCSLQVRRCGRCASQAYVRSVLAHGVG